MRVDEDDILHYGILRKSGRYPWGSGANVIIRSNTFEDLVANARAEGLTDTEIAHGFGMTSTEFRATKSIAKNQIKQEQIATAERLKAKGLSNVAIGEKMGGDRKSVV